MQRLPRIVELLLIVALCALVAFWATRLARGTPIAVPATAAAAPGSAGSRVDEMVASARLFGSRRPGVLSDNVRPLGVVADASGRGSVIVSVDGQPARVYRIGDTLDGRVVTAIRPDEIELDSGGARQTFRLPPPRAMTAGVTVLGTGAALVPPASAPVVGPPPSSPSPSIRGPQAASGPSAPVPGMPLGQNHVPEQRRQRPTHE